MPKSRKPQPRNGDHIEVGNITGSQGLAIGRQARAAVRGNRSLGAGGGDPEALRAALTELHGALAQANLPPQTAITTQTAVGKALEEGVPGSEVKPEAVAANVQKVGEVLKQANVAVQEGSSLWQSVQKLAPLLGPAVGGAQAVAGWFGVPLRFPPG